MKRLLMLGLLAMAGSAGAAQQMTEQQVINMINRAVNRIDISTLYLRNKNIQRALVNAEANNSVRINVVTTEKALFGASDYFANLIYAGYQQDLPRSKGWAYVTDARAVSATAFMMIDRSSLLVGNGTMLPGWSDYPVTLTTDAVKIKQTNEWFDKIMKNSIRVGPYEVYLELLRREDPKIFAKAIKLLDDPHLLEHMMGGLDKPKVTAEELWKKDQPKR